MDLRSVAYRKGADMQFRNGNSKDHHGEHIYLAELAGDDGVLEGFHFTDCQIKGPAVLIVQGEFNFVENEIEGDPDAFLWELSSDQERVIGAISVKDTTFEQCTFTNVGLAGYSEFIEQIRQGVAAQPA